jgi:Holliday junction DNA helicase RuvB
MPLHPEVQERLRQQVENAPNVITGMPKTGKAKVNIKRGAEIFAGTDYPQSFSRFIGQHQAVAQCKAAISSAQQRGTRLDHILLASGTQGIGKTTLARIIAYEMNAGLVEVSGPVTVDDARRILSAMEDGDILFWDEFHLAVQGGKGKAEWLLPFLTDRVLLTKDSVEAMPDVTVLGATTDVGRLPTTVTSRFMVTPQLTYYSDVEAIMLAAQLADRMNVPLDDHFDAIAAASDNNPRQMRVVLTSVRDIILDTGQVDLETAFRWAGVTRDGLSRVCQDFLLALLQAKDHTASLDTLQGLLGEPGPIKYAENQLIAKGLVHITGRGRQLTDEGIERAALLVTER